MTTILFADPCASLRAYVQQELEDEGFRVLVAASAEEAVEMADSERPDLVILDIWMPRMDGFEAAERIVAMDPGIRVVFFTNCDDLCLSDPRSALAAACVEKSYDLSDLKRVIVSLTASRKGKGRFRVGLPPLRGTESAFAFAVTGSA